MEGVNDTLFFFVACTVGLKSEEVRARKRSIGHWQQGRRGTQANHLASLGSTTRQSASDLAMFEYIYARHRERENAVGDPPQ